MSLVSASLSVLLALALALFAATCVQRTQLVVLVRPSIAPERVQFDPAWCRGYCPRFSSIDLRPYCGYTYRYCD